MLLTSTYSPNVTADIPLIIVCHAGRKVFMLKASTYSEMVSEIRQKFNVQVACQLHIETMALDVCRGSSIEVGEDVWPVLMSSLDEILVIVSDDDVDDQVSHKQAIAQIKAEMDRHDGGKLLVGDEERIKEEYVEKWLEQQDEVDDVHPPPSVYSAIAYGVQHQILPAHDQEPSEYEADQFHVCREEEPLANEPSPRVRFEDKELEREEARVDEPQPPSSSIDERFQLTITGPDDQTAEIKTRGKHLVRKVLAAVCKTFDLDYDRSSLYAVTYTINENKGEVEEGVRMCPPDWSIARCGVTSMTELRIQVESQSASDPVASLHHRG